MKNLINLIKRNVGDSLFVGIALSCIAVALIGGAAVLCKAGEFVGRNAQR